MDETMEDIPNQVEEAPVMEDVCLFVFCSYHFRIGTNNIIT